MASASSLNRRVSRRARTPNLIYVLNKFNYIENYATGLKKTLAAYAPYDKKPKYESTDHFVVVTLSNVNYDVHAPDTVPVNAPDTVPVNVPDTVLDKLDSDSAAIIQAMRNEPNVTRQRLAQIIGKTTKTVGRKIAELKEKGYIERIGSDKSGSWEVLR